jgi:hypothetical protein
MRNKKDIRIRDKTRVDLGLFLEDVQTCGVDFPAVESLDEGVFVHDCPTRGVDDHNAVLHLGEFGCADYVAGMFLEISC